MKAKLVILLTAVMLFGAIWSYETTKITQKKIQSTSTPIVKGPPSVQMWDYLIEYSEKYKVPFEIAYGIAKEETGYGGPFDWSYNPRRTSSAGAIGAMQIMPSTASYVWGRRVTTKELMDDLRFNIETSMKYMAYLYDLSGRWDVSLGYYNTGKPIVNDYSIRIIKRLN